MKLLNMLWISHSSLFGRARRARRSDKARLQPALRPESSVIQLLYSSTKRFVTLKAGLPLLVVTALALISLPAYALEQRKFCIWDPVGRNGPVMTFYSDVIPKALAWGVKIRFEAYTEETDVVKAFRTGKCEAAVLTSILSRQFVKFAGTMDAIGAINSQKGLELAIATLARSRAGNLMVEGDYEVITTFPVGSMYAFVRDRTVDTIEEFEGKKLAILNDDPQMKKFADLASASKVNVTLSTFSDMFNNGEVDILIMPALAYNTFELYNGLGKKGGIIDYRLYYGMLQAIAKHKEFPEGFGDKMRSYMLTRMAAMNKMVVDAEEEIPSHYWIETSQFVKDDIDHFSKRVRMALQADNVNNSTALKLFWKIRCRLDPSRGECKESPGLLNNHQKLLAKKQEEQRKAEQEKKKQEQQQQANQRLAKQRQEQARQATLKLEQEKARQERQRLALEQQKQEQARIAAEKERLERERIEQERQAQEAKQEQERIVLEQKRLEEEKRLLEQQRVALEMEKKQLEAEKRSLWDILFGWI